MGFHSTVTALRREDSKVQLPMGEDPRAPLGDVPTLPCAYPALETGPLTLKLVSSDGVL